MFSRLFKNKYEDTYWKEASEGKSEKQVFTDSMEIMVWELFKYTILKKKSERVKKVTVKKEILFTYLRSYSDEEMERTMNADWLNVKA